MAETRVMSADRMRELTVGILAKVGVPAADAEFMGDCLVDSDIRGVLTHGVRFLPIYYRWIKAGNIKVEPEIKVISEAPGMIAYDADQSLGHLVSAKAMRTCIEKAKKVGVGVATIRNSRHCGAMAFYAQMAADAGCIGQAITNGGVLMAPYGGIDRAVGLNPVAWAAPTGKPWSFNVDMATSVVAGSKVALAQEKGESIPPGWAIDKDGKPTTDPTAARNGAMLPLGGYKGYDLGIVLDILGGVLGGGRFGAYQGVDKFATKENQFSQFFLAISIEHFMPLSEFKERMDQLIDKLKAGRLAENSLGIFLPGEIEYKTRLRCQAEGIPYPAHVVAEIEQIAAELGVA
ncbi:MAG: Ldh family oxidoreductase [Chloroflexota bacterium]